MEPSKRIKNVPPYIFARIEKVRDTLKAKGVDIVDLGIGDPDNPTVPQVVSAMHKAIDDPSTHNYPPYEGTMPFRKAVADWYKRRFSVELNPEKEVLSLIGSKEGLAHICWAFIDSGDISLVPDPSYPVYKINTLLAGGIVHPVPLLEKNKFLPDLRSIDKKIAKKAKLLFINYPNNPTAAICDKKFFTEAVEFAKENELLLCSDLAYSEVAYDGYKPMSVLEIPGAKDVCIEFHSLSKTFNMTGWRIGMAVGNEKAIASLSVIKTNVDSGVFKAIQIASIEALKNYTGPSIEMNKVYMKRRDILIDGLCELGWDLEKTKATFYVWCKVPKGYNSESFCAEVLEKAAVLLVPGNGYGVCGEGYFRMSITVKEERITEAINRMRKAGIKFK